MRLALTSSSFYFDVAETLHYELSLKRFISEIGLFIAPKQMGYVIKLDIVNT